MIESRIAVADAEQRDEREREQRPADRAEVVHRALEAVGAPVGGGGHDVGEQRVAGGHAQPARGPRRRRAGRRPATRCVATPIETARARRSSRSRRRRRCGGGRGSSASAPPASRAAPASPSEMPSISAERRGGGAERAGEEARQQRGRDLVPEVGEQAGGRRSPLTPGVSQRSGGSSLAGLGRWSSCSVTGVVWR